MHTVYTQLSLSYVFTINRINIFINTFHSPYYYD